LIGCAEEEKSGQVNTAERGMPDGYSRVKPNGLSTLIEVLASIRDVTGKILLEGFCSGVRAIGPEEELYLSKILILVCRPFSDTRYGVP